MASSRESDVDLLLAHGAFVRSLARRIVSDEHRAEDLAQETWVAALSRPADAVRSPRAWLSGILANLTRSEARTRARRERREAETARRETVPSTDSTVASASLGRDLADRVLALEEPFRTTILLRFYEDLPPRAIARRMRVPVRTVNSRLARGLERLRAGFRREGADRSWIAGLVLLAEPSEIVRTGVLWMNAKQVVGIAAAVAVTAGAIAWMRSGAGEPATPTAPRAEVASAPLEPTPAAASSPLAPAAPEHAPTRAPGIAVAPTVEPSAPETAAAATRRIRGRVFGPDAFPRAGVEVNFDCGLEPPPRATSGAGGAFELVVPAADGKPREGVLRAADPSLVNVSVGWVRAGREAEPIVVVAPARDLGGKVVDASGAPLAGVQLALQPPEGFMRRLDAVLDATERSDAKTTSDAAGAFALPRSADVPGARVVGKLEGFETAILEVLAGTDLGLVVEMHPKRAEVGEIEGTVVDASNARVAGAFVSLGFRSAVTDGRGEFRLATTKAEDAVDLVAIHPGQLPGRVRADRDPASGKPVWPSDLVVRLGAAPLSMTGTVVDGEGRPRVGVRIWLEDPTRFGLTGDDDTATVESLVGGKTMEGDDYWRSTATDAAGAFELGGLVDREYKVGLLDLKALDLLRTGPFSAGARDVRIVFERAPPRKISGRVLSARGLPVPGVSLDLMRPTYGGISMSIDSGIRVSDAEGKFAFEDVRGKELLVWVRGDDVIPKMIPVPDEIGEEGFDVHLAVRCHFKVHLAPGTAADRLRVLDADGAEMNLLDITPSGVTTMKEASIVDGRSAALGVEEGAWTLSILRNGAEVLRRELRLVPGILNVIEL
jgi:RNA polymerase sigma factor (sigma-70 family)